MSPTRAFRNMPCKKCNENTTKLNQRFFIPVKTPGTDRQNADPFRALQQ